MVQGIIARKFNISDNPSSPASKDNEKIKYKMAKADYLFGYHPESIKLIWTPPESFSDVVKPPAGWHGGTLEDLREKMKKGVELDPLFVDIEPKYCSIRSHEGRHRAKVAAELGIEKVPVIIYCRSQDRGYVKYFECEHCEYVFEKWKWKKERERA